MDTDAIAYFDENGQTRAVMGRVVTTTPATGAETTYPAAVVLYDAEGNVIWRESRLTVGELLNGYPTSL